METPPVPYGAAAIAVGPQAFEHSKMTHVDLGQGVVLLRPVELMRQTQPLMENATQLHSQSERAVIDSDANYVKGTEFLTTCTNQWNLLEELRKLAKAPVDDLAKFIQSQCRPSQDLLTEAKAAVSTKMLHYRKEVENARALEAARVRKQQEEEALKIAQDEENKGNASLASAIVDAVVTPATTVRTAPIGGARTNSFGRSTNVVSRWVGTVVEPMMVLQGIISGKIPISCIDWSAIELNKVAKAIGVEGTYLGIKVAKAESLQQK